MGTEALDRASGLALPVNVGEALRMPLATEPLDTVTNIARKPLGLVLMVQGTSSHAGKTTLVAALCRVFRQSGFSVAPFKAQNMSNNAAVTDDGLEVGRAQAMQAAAAGIPVTVDMNPVLLKPQSDRTSQVVVLGKPWYTKDAVSYYARKAELWPVVTGALDRLRAQYDIVVIEGAGSPAEINLAQYDIVNMRVARYANSPVLLVGDIERGGVFASLFGTHALLQPEERALIKAFVINKFRGDASLLDPGYAMLEERTGVPTIGTLPWWDLSHLPAEDALEWDTLGRRDESPSAIDIAVMRLPRVANLDEFQPLAAEPGVRVRFVASPADLGSPDLIIIPGTKSTLGDLAWLRERGLSTAIITRREQGTPVLGICGGFQMLGTRIVDSLGVEQRGESVGLGLLPVETEFAAEKITRKVTARVSGKHALWHDADVTSQYAQSGELTGYEIHMGRTTVMEGAVVGGTPFVMRVGSDDASDGLTSEDGLVVGTYMHGLLENGALRHALLKRLAERKGIAVPERGMRMSVDQAFDVLASSVTAHMDMDAVFAMMGLSQIHSVSDSHV
jgi:adenosylcobyric acid synthase